MRNFSIAAVLAYFFGHHVVTGYENARRRIAWLAMALLVLSVLGVVANYVGTTYGLTWLRQANLALGCFLAIVSAYALTCPLVVGVILVRDYIRPGTAEDTIRALGKSVAWYLLGMSFFFLVCGTLPISRNWMGVFAVYLGVFVVILCGPTFGMRTLFAKWIIYGYSVTVVALAISGMVSGAAYKKVVGFDPFTYLRITAVDVKVDQIQQIRDKNAERDALRKLDVILQKEKRGESLSQEEKDLMKRAEHNTLPGKTADVAVAGYGATVSAAGAVYDAAASGLKGVFSAKSTPALTSPATASKQPAIYNEAWIKAKIQEFIKEPGWETIALETIEFQANGDWPVVSKGQPLSASLGERVIYTATADCSITGGHPLPAGKVMRCAVAEAGAIMASGTGSAGKLTVLLQRPQS